MGMGLAGREVYGESSGWRELGAAWLGAGEGGSGLTGWPHRPSFLSCADDSREPRVAWREGGREAGSESRAWRLAVACGTWLGVWNLDGSLSLAGAAGLPACRPRWRHSFGQQMTQSAFSLKRIALAII